MFEDSTFESTGRIRTRSRRWMIAAFALNGSILATLILIPLIYPDALPHIGPLILMEAPPPPATPPPAPKQPQHFHGTPEMSCTRIFASPQMPSRIANFKDEGPPPSGSLAEMSDGPGVPGGIDRAFRGHETAPVVRAAPRGPVRISSLVMSTPVSRTDPVYPAIAKATGTQGTVVLQAVISKTGTIENLRVVSGPPLLQQAALDAVKQWRYRPYLLNGEPIEVETTVNVVFTLGR